MPTWKQGIDGAWWTGRPMWQLRVRPLPDGRWIADAPERDAGTYPTRVAAQREVVRLYRRELRKALAALK